MPRLALTVNGQPRALEGIPHEASLLHVLRNDCGLNGPKYGCGLGQCGACTVHVDGTAARACVIPAHGVVGRSITTLEGLAELAPGQDGSSTEDPADTTAAQRIARHPVLRAF